MIHEVCAILVLLNLRFWISCSSINFYKIIPLLDYLGSELVLLECFKKHEKRWEWKKRRKVEEERWEWVITFFLGWCVYDKSVGDSRHTSINLNSTFLFHFFYMKDKSETMCPAPLSLSLQLDHSRNITSSCYYLTIKLIMPFTLFNHLLLSYSTHFMSSSGPFL